MSEQARWHSALNMLSLLCGHPLRAACWPAASCPPSRQGRWLTERSAQGTPSLVFGEGKHSNQRKQGFVLRFHDLCSLPTRLGVSSLQLQHSLRGCFFMELAVSGCTSTLPTKKSSLSIRRKGSSPSMGQNAPVVHAGFQQFAQFPLPWDKMHPWFMQAFNNSHIGTHTHIISYSPHPAISPFHPAFHTTLCLPLLQTR